MGPARKFVAVLASIVLALAGVGLWHLFATGGQTASALRSREAAKATPAASPASLPASVGIAPSVQKNATAPPAIPIPPAMPAASRQVGEGERAIAITTTTQTKKRGRRGETFVVATIGIAPRPNTEKGEVEIHVFFFDLTPNNEIRPTDAQVTYEWLTPVRDWNDPTPKYLAASYLEPRRGHRSFERLRYGGFMVRVYAGGQLQDERSEPQGLLSLLRSGGHHGAPPRDSGAEIAPGPAVVATPAVANKGPANSKAPGPKVPVSPVEKIVSKDSTTPVGKPVPGKAGFVSSPFDAKFIIDVRGFPPGTLVNDPNTDKTFRVP